MARFKAEEPDLVLELTTLAGEEITLSPTKQVSGKMAIEITQHWTELESKDGFSPINLISEELAYIYPKDSDWFLENFDLKTLNDILVYVAQTVGGLKKKSRN